MRRRFTAPTSPRKGFGVKIRGERRRYNEIAGRQRPINVAGNPGLWGNLSLPTLLGMKRFGQVLTILFIGFAVCVRVDGQTNSAAASAQLVETIVSFRHGEKPAGGLGQLTCRGLNRALALPAVLFAKYGTPQFLFAPNPTQRVDGKNHAEYFYVRPLATIEPLAIRCGLPVNTQFGYLEIKGLEIELQKPEYRNATIFVTWEHGLLDDFVKDLVKSHGGDARQVPPWPHDDFDSIFVVKITRSEGRESVAFAIDHENLNNLSDTCP